jgi:hypothetical protein
MTTKVRLARCMPSISLLELANPDLCLPSVAVESDAANKMVDLIREKLVNGDLSEIPADESGFNLVGAEEFE